ncbi:hypothetical protein [Polyangium sp. 6x1]|uniref:hypothetical protein n=1 Tax=Polyangium sp. 6x1 TaxID=3042689 RepID=UPI0024824FB1|nr:hypothetical protein [Polyangium sp. 6x1]MDI1444619.1 hypothetical protein [Polyangium sp. 6x1]
MKGRESGASLKDRVRTAWEDLPPVGPRQQPPSFRTLEEKHGLPSGIFSRVISGKTATLTQRNAERMAQALNVPLSWLLTGETEAPAPRSRSPEAARNLAIEWARWEQIDERAIQMVQVMPLYPYSPRAWLCMIELCQANLRLGQGPQQPPDIGTPGA